MVTNLRLRPFIPPKAVQRCEGLGGEAGAIRPRVAQVRIAGLQDGMPPPWFIDRISECDTLDVLGFVPSSP
jgi:hypothetical protein